MPTVELRFSAVPAHVRTARLIASTVGRRVGLDASIVDEVKLAVGEACARAVGRQVEHGISDDVVVRFADDAGVFGVEVVDFAPPGDDASDADLGALAELDGDLDVALPVGYALAVIAGLVDDVEVTAEPGSTTVRMRWPLGASPSA